jgi:molybdate transport system regulatory protein
MSTGGAKPAVRFHICDRNAKAKAWIGPGKIALLEAIASTGSITAAARELGMSYRRAWLLVEETNRCLASPAVQTATGGQRGGGTALTPVGIELCRRYRSIEQSVEKAVTRELQPILRKPGAGRRTPD